MLSARARLCLFALLVTESIAFASATRPAPLLGSNSLAIVELQTGLVRAGISPGPIDGLTGPQTTAALRAFQRKLGLPPTGVPDDTTRTNLAFPEPLFVSYVVASNDVERLLPLWPTWLGKSLQPRLDYETVLELISEKSQSHPKLIQTLNPSINWTNVTNGMVVIVPNAVLPPPNTKAAFVNIRLGERVLEAYDSETNLLAHFPCSIAQRVDKRPIGELRVSVLAPNPNYTFDPTVFPESPEAQEMGRKLILQPGPNNPVGTVWIGLDRAGYGIHGTPLPEKVGRTESHGCFRLANWNAEHLLKLVSIGTPVIIQP